MAEIENEKSSRPGPIGFHAESKVSNQPYIQSINSGGIGEAQGPTKETPSGAKVLKVAPIKFWVLIGFLVIFLGVISVSILVIVLGLFIVLCAGLAKRRIMTETRLRKDSQLRGEI